MFIKCPSAAPTHGAGTGHTAASLDIVSVRSGDAQRFRSVLSFSGEPDAKLRTCDFSTPLATES